MSSYSIDKIEKDSKFTQSVFLDKSFLLLDMACPFSDNLRKALEKWRFSAVLSEGKPGLSSISSFTEKDYLRKTESSSLLSSSKASSDASKEIPKDVKYEEISIDDFGLDFGSDSEKNGESNSSSQEKAPAAMASPSSSVSSAPKVPSSASQSQNSPQATSEAKKPTHIDTTQNLADSIFEKGVDDENKKMSEVEMIYNDYSAYILKLYTRFATHKELPLADISEKIQDLCIFIRENKKYVLRLTPHAVESGKDFLISHALRSTVYAVVVGLQMNMPMTKLIELAVTCVLHEIGQIRLPPQLYLTNRQLSANERTQLATHTVLGYNILKDHGFPLSMSLGVLDHHERENGTGYPRKITGNKISPFAKIISVACSFEAITAPRHYKEERTTFEAMVEMLKNEQKQYDDTVIKALLISVSLYPIGAYVYLSNGKLAQVTDTNPSDPRNPIVQIVGEKNVAGNPMTIQIDGTNTRITKVLTKKESSELLKSKQ